MAIALRAPEAACRLALAGILIAVFPLVVWFSLNIRFHIDERQFIASGALLAREGLIPILDYPYFHQPNMVLVYAALFSFTDELMLSARTLTGLFSWVGLVAVAIASYKRFERPAVGLLTATAALSLILASPFLVTTVGRSWNQDSSITLTLLATLAMAHAATRATRPTRWAAVAGALLGFAVGTRITCAPLLAVFLCMIPLSPVRTRRQRLRMVVAMTAAASFMLLPTIAIFVLNPVSFRFCTFSFPLINLEYMYEANPDASYSLADKMRLIWPSLLEPGSVMLTAGLLLFAWPAAMTAARRGHSPKGDGLFEWYELRLVLAAAAAGVVASLVPTPGFRQYYFTSVPLLVLLVAYSAAYLHRYGHARHRRPAMILTASIIAVCVLMTAPRWARGFQIVNDPEYRWQYNSVVAEHLRRIPLDGNILTLTPIPVLEAGHHIEPRLATGLIATRLTPRLTDWKRDELNLIGETNYDEVFALDMPAAVLCRLAPLDYDLPLMRFALRHGYRRTVLMDDVEIWTHPDQDVPTYKELYSLRALRPQHKINRARRKQMAIARTMSPPKNTSVVTQADTE